LDSNKKGASRISGRACFFQFYLLLLEYQIGGGNYDMISIFIFRFESVGWQEMGGLGGLTRFGRWAVFGSFWDFL
jgi:hypothetical protein